MDHEMSYLSILFLRCQLDIYIYIYLIHLIDPLFKIKVKDNVSLLTDKMRSNGIGDTMQIALS